MQIQTIYVRMSIYSSERVSLKFGEKTLSLRGKLNNVRIDVVDYLRARSIKSRYLAFSRCSSLTFRGGTILSHLVGKVATMQPSFVSGSRLIVTSSGWETASLWIRVIHLRSSLENMYRDSSFIVLMQVYMDILR